MISIKHIVTGVLVTGFISAVLGFPTLNRRYGEAGFSFLKLHLGPRSVALGGAGAAYGSQNAHQLIIRLHDERGRRNGGRMHISS